MLEIKYKTKPGMEEIYRLGFVENEKSNWIDLRTTHKTYLKFGEYALLDLGIAMQLPDGYEGILLPRSSTFKNFHIIQTNSMGVIDNSYCGDEDYWMMPVYALRDTCIPAHTRICQFRLQKVMDRDIKLTMVKSLNNESRGGFGTTGNK